MIIMKNDTESRLQDLADTSMGVEKMEEAIQTGTFSFDALNLALFKNIELIRNANDEWEASVHINKKLIDEGIDPAREAYKEYMERYRKWVDALEAGMEKEREEAEFMQHYISLLTTVAHTYQITTAEGIEPMIVKLEELQPVAKKAFKGFRAIIKKNKHGKGNDGIILSYENDKTKLEYNPINGGFEGSIKLGF